MPTKAEQTERTRAALVAAGRRLFAERGFAATSTEDLVRAAGVSRGALYHHFADKRALFEAVYEDVEARLAEQLAASLTRVSDPLELLQLGAAAFLDACLEPAVQRIALLEAPGILGWQRWREIDQAYGLGMVQAALALAMQAGAIRTVPVEPLAQVLLGGLVEAGLMLAAAPDPAAIRVEVGQAMAAVLDGLAAAAAAPPPGGARS